MTGKDFLIIDKPYMGNNIFTGSPVDWLQIIQTGTRIYGRSYYLFKILMMTYATRSKYLLF